MAALSFCTTARSSAMVFEARTLRMNCFTVINFNQPLPALTMLHIGYTGVAIQELILAASQTFACSQISILLPLNDGVSLSHRSHSMERRVGIQNRAPRQTTKRSNARSETNTNVQAHTAEPLIGRACVRQDPHVMGKSRMLSQLLPLERM